MRVINVMPKPIPHCADRVGELSPTVTGLDVVAVVLVGFVCPVAIMLVTGWPLVSVGILVMARAVVCG